MSQLLSHSNNNLRSHYYYYYYRTPQLNRFLVQLGRIISSWSEG